ncbi:MAG: hypothetical protein OEU84_01210 [Xanthomonadales bacterium]|nr:hypothetical protein [Xanthomonadales bacterium]MDH4018197.1 hypothetical protein [Xanthomonadales bacterium]
MKIANLKYGLIAIAGLGISANASAALTCEDIVFSPEAFEAYEFVDKACLEMVDRNGVMFAKLTARVVAQTASGTHLRYRHADGQLGPSHLSTAPNDFETMMSGEPVRMVDLAVRQQINIYVGSKYWVDPTLLVEEAIVEEMVEEAIVEEVIEEEIIEEEMEAELPTTAGPLPWLALFGSLFLILGGALRFSRKQ